MDLGAEPYCFEVRLENGRKLDPAFCKMPRNKFVGRDRTYGLCNQDRRAMPTIGEEN
jgi:hypothetical protein